MTGAVTRRHLLAAAGAIVVVTGAARRPDNRGRQRPKRGAAVLYADSTPVTYSDTSGVYYR